MSTSYLKRIQKQILLLENLKLNMFIPVARRKCWNCTFLQTADALHLYFSYISHQHVNSDVINELMVSSERWGGWVMMNTHCCFLVTLCGISMGDCGIKPQCLSLTHCKLLLQVVFEPPDLGLSNWPIPAFPGAFVSPNMGILNQNTSFSLTTTSVFCT